MTTPETEAVARAICVQQDIDPDWKVARFSKNDLVPYWTTLTGQAIAAIKAMKPLIEAAYHEGARDDVDCMWRDSAAESYATRIIAKATGEGE